MKAFLFLVTLLASGAFAQTQKLIQPTTTSGNPWVIVLSTVGGVDRITVANTGWSEKYVMSQSDVTPSLFALTYNTIKDAWINDDKVDFVITYTGSSSNGTIIGVHMEAK